MKIFFLKVSHFELSSAIVTCTVSPIVFAFFSSRCCLPLCFSRCGFSAQSRKPQRGSKTGRARSWGAMAEPWGVTTGRHNGRTTTGKMMQNEKCHFYIFNIFLKIDFYQQIMSTISFKTFSGSFSRYWNKKKLNFFFKIFFVKRCSTMKFLPINYVQNQV